MYYNIYFEKCIVVICSSWMQYLRFQNSLAYIKCQVIQINMPYDQFVSLSNCLCQTNVRNKTKMWPTTNNICRVRRNEQYRISAYVDGLVQSRQVSRYQCISKVPNCNCSSMHPSWIFEHRSGKTVYRIHTF